MIQSTEGQKQATKRFKYILLKTLFNFIKNATDSSFVNPCDSSILKKTFRHSKGRQWTIIEKDIVDEIIFKTDNPRNRLMLELMARGGMWIGEVLKLRAMDVDDCKLFLINPKSGRPNEVVFIPKKVADRLKEYIRLKLIETQQRIFPIGYTGARQVVKKAGRKIGVELSPLMISDGMLRPMQADPERPLKLSARSFSDLQIYQLPNDIWAKSAIFRQCGGLKTYSVNLKEKNQDRLLPAPV